MNANAIALGVVDTLVMDACGPESKVATVKGLVRGMGRPEDIADAVVFLASDHSKYITGETLDVNGGILMD